MFLFACTSPETPEKPLDTQVESLPDADSTSDSPSDSPSDSLGTAEVEFSNIQVSPGSISTTLWVSWETSRPGRAWIEWTETGDAVAYQHQTRISEESLSEHYFLLAGLPPSSSGSWRLVHEEGGQVAYSEAVDFETEAGSNLPGLQVLQSSDELDGYFLMPVESAGMVAVFDRRGRPVWWWESELPGFLARARYRDGSIWFNQYNKDLGLDSYIVAVPEAADSSDLYVVPGNHHDFWVDEEGMAVIYQDRDLGPDGELWTGDKLVWQPWVGDAVELWSSWDHVTQSGGTGENFFPGTTDWMHCNGVDRQADLFVLSCKGQDAVYAIGMDGSTPWVFGGQDGTVSVPPPTLNLIHGPTLNGQELWIFSNTVLSGSQGPEILSYTLSGDFASATLTARYEIADLEALHFGNVVIRDNNNRVVSFGWGGRLVELSPTMELLADYDLPFGGTYFDFVPHLGGPVAEPF